MTSEELKAILFDPTMRSYAVLDAGNIPDLPKELYKTELESYCLMEGELPADVIYQAPYLVRLLPGHKFTDWLLEDFIGKNKGIFAHSRATLIEMRRHFTSLVKVHDETGRPLIFRYYDPRVFRKFIPTCRPEELEVFFGDVARFFVEQEENGSEMVRYEFEENDVKTLVIGESEE